MNVFAFNAAAEDSRRLLRSYQPPHPDTVPAVRFLADFNRFRITRPTSEGTQRSVAKRQKPRNFPLKLSPDASFGGSDWLNELQYPNDGLPLTSIALAVKHDGQTPTVITRTNTITGAHSQRGRASAEVTQVQARAEVTPADETGTSTVAVGCQRL